MTNGEQLLDHRVSAFHGNAKGFSVEEIDIHPDSKRIWATISEIRKAHEILVKYELEDSEYDKRELNNTIYELESEIEDLKKEINIQED